MNHLRVFQAIWIGPTNTLGDRVKLIDHRTGQKVTIPVKYHDIDKDARQIATEFLSSIGIDVVAFGTADKGYFLMSDNFEKLMR